MARPAGTRPSAVGPQSRRVDSQPPWPRNEIGVAGCRFDERPARKSGSDWVHLGGSHEATPEAPVVFVKTLAQCELSELDLSRSRRDLVPTSARILDILRARGEMQTTLDTVGRDGGACHRRRGDHGAWSVRPSLDR
jgi:hypothetical protein